MEDCNADFECILGYYIVGISELPVWAGVSESGRCEISESKLLSRMGFLNGNSSHGCAPVLLVGPPVLKYFSTCFDEHKSCFLGVKGFNITSYICHCKRPKKTRDWDGTQGLQTQTVSWVSSRATSEQRGLLLNVQLDRLGTCHLPFKPGHPLGCQPWPWLQPTPFWRHLSFESRLSYCCRRPHVGEERAYVAWVKPCHFTFVCFGSALGKSLELLVKESLGI